MNKMLMTLASGAARLLPMWVKRLIYRLPWLASCIRGNLNRAVPSGLTQVEVAAGGLAGMRLYLDLKSEKDYWLGTYEPELQKGILELVKPGMVAYDLGANIGYMSLLLAKAVESTGSVYAFEAFPQNARRLAQNVALNGLQQRVKIVEAAVSDCSSPLRFWIGPSGNTGKVEGSAGRQGAIYSDSIVVQGYALDDFVYQENHPQPQALKIDIEGGEVLALPGMRRVLTQSHPLVLLELHGPESARVAWSELDSAGYRICHLRPGYPPVASLEELDWKAYLVAFPKRGDVVNDD